MRYLLGILLGAAAMWGYYHMPHQDRFTITSATECLTAEGLSFSLKYSGRGVAVFQVVPPATTTSTLPEQGKKERKK